MSIEAIAFVKAQDLGSAESAQARLLLYVIAENTFNDSFVCVLGQDQLAYESGRVSERTVRRHIDDLVAARLLLCRKRYPAAGGRLPDALRIVGFKRWYHANHRANPRRKPAKALPDNLSGRGGGLPDKVSGRATGQQVSGVTGQQVSGTYKASRTSPVLSEEARERADDFGFEGKAVRDLLRQMLGDEVFVAWFQGMAFSVIGDGHVEARAANAFKAKWIIQNFERQLIDACRKVNASVTHVAVVGPGRAERPAPAAEVAP